MLKLKKGQEIEKQGGQKYEVLAIADGAYYLRSSSVLTTDWYTDSEIEANFILPKEKWVPKEGDPYYRFNSELVIFTRIHGENSPKSNGMIKAGNCFQTEAEAQKVVEEIKKLLNK